MLHHDPSVQPASNYSSALGTLQLLFERKAEGLMPVNYQDALHWAAWHYAKHVHVAGTGAALNLHEGLVAATKGSRGYLQADGNRPEELCEATSGLAGWVLIYAQDVVEIGRTFNGGTYYYEYLHRDTKGRQHVNHVRCTVSREMGTWMHIELEHAEGDVFHFSRGCLQGSTGKQVPAYDGFVACAVTGSQPPVRTVAALHSGNSAGLGRYSLVTYDTRSGVRLVTRYDTNDVSHAKCYKLKAKLREFARGWQPADMVGGSAMNACVSEDGPEYLGRLAAEHVAILGKKNVAEVLAEDGEAISEGLRRRLRRVLLRWEEAVDKKRAGDPAMQALKARAAVAQLAADEVMGDVVTVAPSWR